MSHKRRHKGASRDEDCSTIVESDEAVMAHESNNAQRLIGQQPQEQQQQEECDVTTLFAPNHIKLMIREEAPDIELPDMNGKVRKLSELKGQVVLLDFWASWCRPCRVENPNVVRVYDKYNPEGFTVYSVSLDGLDSRTKRRF